MIEVFVEIEAGSRDKRLYDEETLQYKETRRVLQPYPFPYGFVLGTRSEDGEYVDCRPDPVQRQGSGIPAGTAIGAESEDNRSTGITGAKAAGTSAARSINGRFK
jgi:hypothetical protein